MGLIWYFRDDAALTRVLRNEDPYVSDYAELLHFENEKLRMTLWRDARVGFSTDGRRAFGRLMAALLALGGIVWTLGAVVAATV